jgi:hypothetical protein
MADELQWRASGSAVNVACPSCGQMITLQIVVTTAKGQAPGNTGCRLFVGIDPAVDTDDIVVAHLSEYHGGPSAA